MTTSDHATTSDQLQVVTMSSSELEDVSDVFHEAAVKNAARKSAAQKAAERGRRVTDLTLLSETDQGDGTVKRVWLAATEPADDAEGGTR